MLRKPVATDSFQSLQEEAERLRTSLQSLINYAVAFGMSSGIQQRYGSIHSQLLQITRMLENSVKPEKRVWFTIWRQDIQELEAKYDSIRRQGLSTIKELEEPLLNH